MLSIVDPKRLLPALLIAGLILMTAVSPTGAGNEAAAPEPHTVHRIVVPAAAFVPAYEDFDYTNSGYQLDTLSGIAAYVAPVQFPYPVVTVKTITLHAYDNGGQDFDLHLGRSRPATGTGAIMTVLHSTGQATTDPRAFTTAAISPRVIDSAYHGAYLAVFPPPGTSYRFYGVTIRYEA